MQGTEVDYGLCVTAALGLDGERVSARWFSGGQGKAFGWPGCARAHARASGTPRPRHWYVRARRPFQGCGGATPYKVKQAARRIGERRAATQFLVMKADTQEDSKVVTWLA
jgi:hypothetical protein